MTLRWLMASLHLLALPLGLAAVWWRARALRGPLDNAGLGRVFLADNLWGVAALVWIVTGVARAFGGLEKGTSYYVSQPMFHAKMGLLLTVLALEIWPMMTLIGWRVRTRRGGAVDVARAESLARISDIQALLVVLMVFVATALARGIRP